MVKPLKKLCIPEAQADRLLAEASTLALTHEFGEVIVHVGATYLPTISRVPLMMRLDASHKIQDLLAALGDLFYAPITYSFMLPLASSRYINAINSINDEILLAGFNCIYHPSFVRDDRGRVDRSLYCADGVHMNSNRIDALLSDLALHIQYSFMYEDDVDDFGDME